MFAKYDPQLVKQAKRNKKKQEELKQEFRKWKKQPRTEYEKYKKEDQPVIDAIEQVKQGLEGIGDNVLKAIEENREVEKQMIPYHHHHQDFNDIPQIEQYDSDKDYTLSESEIQKVFNQYEKERKLKDVKKINVSERMLKYINHSEDTVFGLRPVGMFKYIGSLPVKFDGNKVIIAEKEYEGTDGLMTLLTKKTHYYG